MKKYLYAVIIALTFSTGAWAESVKDLRPTGFVNDYANVLSVNEEAKLEKLLENTASIGKAEIAVVTVKTTDGQDIEGYSMEIAEAWGIGEKDKDNGILLLVATEDRKIRIEVGYGLEGVLNDAKCGRIRDNYLTPKLKESQWFAGLYETSEALSSYIDDPEANAEIVEEGKISFKLILILLVLFILSCFVFGPANTISFALGMLCGGRGGSSSSSGFGGGGFGGGGVSGRF